MKKAKKGFKLVKNINIGINVLGLLTTLVFWYLIWDKLQNASTLRHIFEKTSIASTYGFMYADLIWASPLLLFSIIGLNKNKLWGWTIAQMVNILWLYSVTAVLFRDLYLDNIAPGTMLFVPFALAALWQIFALWKYRKNFK